MILRKGRPMSSKELLRQTWIKPWAKTWLLENTTFAVPRTYVHSCSFKELLEWLESASCPLETWFIVKPVNLSQSRGVRLFIRRSSTVKALFQGALLGSLDIDQVQASLKEDLKGPKAAWHKWMVEEYITPPPLELKHCRFEDWPFNPLVRIIMFNGDFHAGELHIPTKESKGRGSLFGGARRICFNYKGELLQERPDIPGDLPWSIANYGTTNDVTGIMLPDFEKLIEQIKTEVCPTLAPTGLFAFDGCYRQKVDGSIEFVCIEIEHSPNVRALAHYNGLRRPC